MTPHKGVSAQAGESNIRCKKCLILAGGCGTLWWEFPLATAIKPVRPKPAGPVKTYAVYTRCDHCGIYDRDPHWCDLCGRPKDLRRPSLADPDRGRRLSG
jgi:hypothetical protein